MLKKQSRHPSSRPYGLSLADINALRFSASEWNSWSYVQSVDFADLYAFLTAKPTLSTLVMV